MKSTLPNPVQLRNHIRSLTPQSRKQLITLLEEEVCPECGSVNFVYTPDKEKVCHHCGLVQNDGGKFVASFRQSSHGDPTCATSYGNGLGDTLPRNQTFKVLAKTVTPKDDDLTPDLSKELQRYLKKNIGLRARYIRIIHSSGDPPSVKKALTFAEQFCKEFGIIGDDFAIQFRNFYGKLLRKVCSLGMFMKRNGETFEAKRFALTSFVFTWQLMEIQNKQRKRIRYQETFPSWNNREKRGLKITSNQYKLRRQDWNFVLTAHRIKFPTIRLRKNNNGELN